MSGEEQEEGRKMSGKEHEEWVDEWRGAGGG
jgi:hypothetical protein